MKVFYSVLGALIAFSVLCGIGYAIYYNYEYGQAVDKCITKMNQLIIQKGDYSLLDSMKTKITKECRESNE